MEATNRKKFIPLEEVSQIPLSELKSLASTAHFSFERRERLATALSLSDEEDEVYSTFLVDTGHRDGYELHNVTMSGLDIILNQKKYNAGQPCLVTVLIARPAQVRRLYNPMDIQIPWEIEEACERHRLAGLNN